MHVHYGNRRGQPIPNYVCVGRGRLLGDPLCQSIVGTRIDAAIGELITEAVTPMALQMSLAVQEEVERRAEDADRLRYRQVERAQYEADLARQRFMRVDPVNRLVADSLEADWNAKLRALDQARDDYERQRRDSRLAVDDEQRRRILALATDLPAVWNDPKTPVREQKRMLALLIEDVTLLKQREVTVAVRFRAGCTTTLTLPRPLTASQLRSTHPEVRRHIDALLDEYTDAQVAHILNERELRTGSGEPFDAVSVQWVRISAKLPSLKDRLRAAGMSTANELCESSASTARRSAVGACRGSSKPASATATDNGSTGFPNRSLPTASPQRNVLRKPLRADPLCEVQYERRVFAVQITRCPTCAGPMRLLDVVTDPDDIARALGERGRARAPPRRPATGQLELDLGAA